MHKDKYIKCPNCKTIRYLNPEKIAKRLNTNLDKEFDRNKRHYLEKLKTVEINLNYLKSKKKRTSKLLFLEKVKIHY